MAGHSTPSPRLSTYGASIHTSTLTSLQVICQSISDFNGASPSVPEWLEVATRPRKEERTRHERTRQYSWTPHFIVNQSLKVKEMLLNICGGHNERELLCTLVKDQQLSTVAKTKTRPQPQIHLGSAANSFGLRSGAMLLYRLGSLQLMDWFRVSSGEVVLYLNKCKKTVVL